MNHQNSVRRLRRPLRKRPPDLVEPAIAAMRESLASLIGRGQINDAAAAVYGALANSRDAGQLDTSITKIASELPHWAGHRLHLLPDNYAFDTLNTDERVVLAITTAIRLAVGPRAEGTAERIAAALYTHRPTVAG